MTHIGSRLGIIAVVVLFALAGATSYGSLGGILGLLVGIGVSWLGVQGLKALQRADRSDWRRW
jgi:hypothetical protein